MQSKLPKFITIVGPTASGKTKLSLEVAKKYNGEILCADSRTVYKGLDIVTAKPTLEERAFVPHHLLDITTPDKPINVAEFKQLAWRVLIEVASRGKLPILVGGSGLYIDSILYDYQFPVPVDMATKQQYATMSLEELVQALSAHSPALARSTDLKNRRRVIRALEVGDQLTTKRDRQLPESLTLGLGQDRTGSSDVISRRIRQMVADGLTQEIQNLVKLYGWDIESLSGIGYRAFRSYIEGKTTLEQAIAAFERGDRQLAKRQITWFKRNPDIHWLERTEDANNLVHEFIFAVSGSERI